MAPVQNYSTSDLRSHAVEFKRDQDNKSKWAHGQVWKDGRNGHAAPIKAKARFPQTNKDMGNHRAQMFQLRATDATAEDNFIPDPDADLDMLELALRPHPLDGIPMSYDLASSPSQGSDILSLAVAKAVERFESTETDRLVQGEWEVLDQTGEVLPQPAGKKGGKQRKNPVGELEAEYEFV